MPAPGRSLEEAIRHLRDLVDAAMLSAEPADPAAGADAPSISARNGRTQPPTANGLALLRLMNSLIVVRAQHPPSPAWAGPLLQHGIVPAATGLLQHLLQAYRQRPGSFRAPAVHGEALQFVREHEADPLTFALMSVWAATGLIGSAAEAYLPGFTDHPPPQPGSPAMRTHTRMWGQLAAPATLQALADAVRWVEAEVWPAERAAAAAASVVEGSRPPVGRGAPPAPGAHPTRPREFKWLWYRKFLSFAQLDARMCNACDVFSLAALVANYAVIDSGGREGDAPGPASTAAAVDRQRGLLAALRGSGLLSALSAAVLAAPLSPEVASDSVELDDVTGIMFHAQHQLFGVLQALTMAIVPGPLLCTARELLAAPDVQQLRWAALEQLAAAAPAAAASTYAAADAGMSLRTGASGSGGGDGGGARGEAGGRWKPMLLQPRVVRLHPVLGGKRMCTLDIMLEAIIGAPRRWLYSTEWGAGASGPAIPNKSARSAAVRSLLPPPRRLAALAAGCCHTLSAEVEAELRRLAACANDDTAGPATETWSHRACEAVALQAAYVAQATSAITAGCSADFVDLLLPEAIVWALRAQMAVMEVDGVAPAAWTASPSSNGAKAAELASSLAYRLHGWTSFSPAKQAAYVQRLLPTGLMGSLDRLLRHLAATGLQTEGERDAVGACAFLMAHLAPPMLRIPLAATPGGAGDSGGGGWRPQDKLGPLLTLAKLARREASQPGGPSLDAPSSAAGLEPHLARAIAGGLVAGAEQLTALLDSLTPPPPLAQREGALGGDRATCAEASSAGAAVREAVALASGTALPLLEWLVARELAGAGGGGGGGGGRRRVGGSGAAGLPPSALADHSAMTMPPLRVSDIPGCYRGIKVLVRCLAAAVQLLPPADLLALQPQRTLALLGRLLQRAHELRRPGARQGGRGGGGRGMGAGAEETEPTRLAGEVAGALVRMAADEELVGAVAGWLGGEVVEGQQQQPQPLRGGLGARVLAAALQSWDGAAAGEVMSFYAAATAAGAPRAKAGGEGGGSNSRGPEAAASGGGATAPLLAAARAAIALRPETTLWGLRGGGAGGIPAWPPRVLRLCSNPGCLNFAGASNGTLPLRKCSGCKGVRYCGAGCQQQHWRSHREECAGRKAAARAVGGDD